MLEPEENAPQETKSRSHRPKKKQKKETEPTPQKYDTHRTDFLIGFIGWFLINSILWAIVQIDFGLLCLGVVVFLGNIILLFVLAFSQSFAPYGKMIALGMLSAYAANFLLTIIFGVAGNATCGVPFFLGELNTSF